MLGSKKWAQNLLSLADIKIGGERAWDIQIRDERFYGSVAHRGSLGLGESYMNGWWDAQELDQFFFKVFGANLESKVRFSWPAVSSFIEGFLLNLQTRSHAFDIGEKHYDVGNDLYKAMLGKSLTYTCGYWPASPASGQGGKDAKNLDEAQEAKLDLVCRKIGLKPGDSVLDIGCGWGSFLKFAAEKYGAHGLGVTVSKEQVNLAKELCGELPVEIRLEDYRNIKGKFDHVVSLGMFEHVGRKNYRDYMEIVHNVLKDGGLFLLHTIGSSRSLVDTDPWIQKYIFPNSMLPSIAQIGKSIEGLFVMEDWHNFGADYDKTLMAWWENFNRAWPELSKSYSDRFYRMWKYYLMTSAASFRSRRIQLWQIVLSKNGVRSGYIPVR